MAPATPHLPQQVPIEGYGKGGFRFADMSHRGSLLCVPSGIWAWPVRDASEIDAAAVAPILSEAEAIDFLVLGCGTKGWMMPEAMRWQFRDARIGLEIMPTGGAIRTYNILLGERRRVAAALIAVE